MRTPPDVYGASRGPLARIADPVAAHMRARRHAMFFSLTGLGTGARILDVGCGGLGLRAQEPDLDITGVDLADRPEYPGPFFRADASVRLPFDDGAFDLVYSNSVVEHVPPRDRMGFAQELRRVGRGLYIQTPAYSFPIEPHALLPFAHWLPVPIRRRYWRLGAQKRWEDIHLLRRAEMVALFPGTRLIPETLGPLTKSWIAMRAVS